jgi:AGCS family alanine or glycine:cation symporter
VVSLRTLTLGISLLLMASGVSAETFDQQVEALVRPLSNGLASIVFFKINLFGQPFPLIVLWLATAALFFTFYMGFINIRGFGLAIRHVKGHYHNPEANGEISHFQAVATAVSGTVGIGNIGGVAVAIVIGGPGQHSGW